MTDPVRNSRRAVIIGAGRVGKTIALIARSLGYSAEFPSKDQAFMPPRLLFITTPDDAICKTAVELSIRQCDWRKTTVLHCSGALSSNELAALKEKGASTGSIHPLKSFVRPARSLEELRDVYWCIEGDATAERASRRVVRAALGRVVKIDADKKAIYHAAAVMAAGHLVALVDASIEMLQECGIERKSALKMILPLVGSAVRNLEHGTENALTGPFARGDRSVIIRHLESLMELNEDYASIYLLLGRRSLKICRRFAAESTESTEKEK